MKNLITFEQNGISPLSWKVLWEMEIESFLFNIIGARDSLLVKIIDKLKLILFADLVFEYLTSVEFKH